MEAKLRELNAVFVDDVFEENYLHRGQLLDDRNAVLRVRKTGNTNLLTYKEDVEATERIIEKLGYRLAVVYEKHRKSWHLGNVEVVLDELPFGYYMEIEGSVQDIIEAEKLLGAERFESELRGYPRLTAKFGKQVNGIMESRFEKTATV